MDRIRWIALLACACGNPSKGDAPGRPKGTIEESTQTTSEEPPVEGCAPGLALTGESVHPDLGSALAAARAGDIVTVCSGTHTGNFVAPVALHIQGEPGAVISGDGGSALSVPGGSIVSGLEITGGASGGLVQSSPGTLLVEACEIRGNQGLSGGGIVLSPGAQATVADSLIEDNDALRGGGLFAGAGASVVLEGTTTLKLNHATEAGGAVFLDAATLSGGVLLDNTAPAGGGLAGIGPITLSATRIEGGLSSQKGGGISIQGDADFVDVIVSGNEAPVGGGAHIEGGALTVSGTSEFSSNTAGSGGGLALIDASVSGGTYRDNIGNGGGVYASGQWGISGISAIDNDASIIYGFGGGALLVGSGVVEGSIFSGNRAMLFGAGVHAAGENFSFVDCEITDNSDPLWDLVYVGGIYVELWTETAGQVLVERSIVSGNTGAFDGGIEVVAFYGRIELQVVDSEVTSNHPSGAGAWFWGTPDTITSIGSDWGSGVEDNTVDIQGDSTDYGADASFVCTSYGVPCEVTD